MRLLGLDIGDRRIGVAISDPDQILASPLTTIIIGDSDDEALKSISDLVTAYRVQRIVIGLPYSMNGSIGKQAIKVKAFTEKLAEYVTVGIEFQDERLSTVAVDRLLIEAGKKNRKKKEQRDAAAAAYILQGYIDRLKEEN
jgi:putative Holliday junction resolvase